MVPSRQERKENITKIRKQQILDAALAVFSEKGFAAATTAEIAQAAGIAEGTIYNYFKSKRELFIAVIKNFIITMPLLNLLSQMPKGDFPTILKGILKDRFDLVKNPQFARVPLIMSEVQRDPELKALWLKEFLHPLLDGIEMIVHMMGATGRFRKVQPEVLVRLMAGMFMGFLLLRVVEGDTSPLNKLNQEKVSDDIVGFILHGLLNRPEGVK